MPDQNCIFTLGKCINGRCNNFHSTNDHKRICFLTKWLSEGRGWSLNSEKILLAFCLGNIAFLFPPFPSVFHCLPPPLPRFVPWNPKIPVMVDVHQAFGGGSGSFSLSPNSWCVSIIYSYILLVNVFTLIRV